MTPEKRIIGLLVLRQNLVRRHNRLVYAKADRKTLDKSAYQIGLVVRKLYLMGE